MAENVPMGAVGERDAVLAFKALGMRVIAVETPEQTAAALFALAQAGTRVIFITETVAEAAPEALSRYQSTPEVAVIPIPGSHGATGYGMRRVRANVEKAIGADILFNNDEREGT